MIWPSSSAGCAGQLMHQLARAPDYLDDHLLHELGINPPDE
jgi:hypothetical protein